MNFEFWPAIISAAAAFGTAVGLRGARRRGSALLLLIGVAAAVASIVAWFWLWPDAHRTGLLDGFSAIVHDAVHLAVVGGAAWLGWKSADL